jgi:hypothetical protein
MKSFAYLGKLNIITNSDANCVKPWPAASHRRSHWQIHPFPTRAVAPRRPLKSTNFYYPAKIFRLLSTIAMTMIRTLALSADCRAVRIGACARTQAPQ